jgi:hypothetical protein
MDKEAELVTLTPLTNLMMVNNDLLITSGPRTNATLSLIPSPGTLPIANLEPMVPLKLSRVFSLAFTEQQYILLVGDGKTRVLQFGERKEKKGVQIQEVENVEGLDVSSETEALSHDGPLCLQVIGGKLIVARHEAGTFKRLYDREAPSSLIEDGGISLAGHSFVVAQNKLHWATE